MNEACKKWHNFSNCFTFRTPGIAQKLVNEYLTKLQQCLKTYVGKLSSDLILWDNLWGRLCVVGGETFCAIKILPTQHMNTSESVYYKSYRKSNIKSHFYFHLDSLVWNPLATRSCNQGWNHPNNYSTERRDFAPRIPLRSLCKRASCEKLIYVVSLRSFRYSRLMMKNFYFYKHEHRIMNPCK